MRRISHHLISKSQEAFILALEVYNRPTIQYRIETFSFLYCNAWELLLKAKIIEDIGNRKAIYYRKKRNQPRRTFSLRDCIKKVFPNEKDPVRKNVEDIIEIRDAAVHYIVPELEYVYQGMFQSGVLNYVSSLQEWFGVFITDKCTPAMLSLLTDISDIDPVKLQKKYGNEIVEFITKERKRINVAAQEINDTKYRIPIEYRLILSKVKRGADISLTTGPCAQAGLIIQIPKDIKRTHPYLTKEVVDKVKIRLEDEIFFNIYDFQAVVYKEKIKGKVQFHYKIEKPECHRYSESLIDFIVEKINADPTYKKRVRASYQSFLREKREARMREKSA